MYKLFVFIALIISPLYGNPLIEGFWDSWRVQDSMESVLAMPVDVYHAYAAEMCVKDTRNYELQTTGAHKERMQKFIKLAHQKGKKVVMVLTNFYAINELIETESDKDAISQALISYIEGMQLDGLNFFIHGEDEGVHLTALAQKVKKRLPKTDLYFTSFLFGTTKAALQKEPHLFSGILYFSIAPQKSAAGCIEELHSLGVKNSQISLLMLPENETISGEEEWDQEAIEDRALFVTQEALRGISILSLTADLAMLKQCGYNISNTFKSAL